MVTGLCRENVGHMSHIHSMLASITAKPHDSGTIGGAFESMSPERAYHEWPWVLTHGNGMPRTRPDPDGVHQ